MVFRKAVKHPLYFLLHDEPNPEMTSFVFGGDIDDAFHLSVKFGFSVHCPYKISEIGNNNTCDQKNILLLPICDIMAINMMFHNQSMDRCEAKICLKINWVLLNQQN